MGWVAMSLTSKQKNYLRALAQHRRVVVTVGNAGLTDSVFMELDHALNRHELLKIRLPSIPREERESVLTRICEKLDAILIQSIGRVGVFYRRSEKPRITFPM
jgi:RNA-binding protein